MSVKSVLDYIAKQHYLATVPLCALNGLMIAVWIVFSIIAMCFNHFWFGLLSLLSLVLICILAYPLGKYVKEKSDYLSEGENSFLVFVPILVLFLLPIVLVYKVAFQKPLSTICRKYKVAFQKPLSTICRKYNEWVELTLLSEKTELERIEAKKAKLEAQLAKLEGEN